MTAKTLRSVREWPHEARGVLVAAAASATMTAAPLEAGCGDKGSMPIVVGIDEAGYGPLLGPLVVTGVALDVADDALDACLWRRLQSSITRRVSKSDLRIPVIDSKKLYSRKAGLGMLERTALVMAAAGGIEADTFRDLLGRVAPHVVDDLSDHPWYRTFDVKLPVANDPVDVALRANAVAKDMRDSGVRLIGVFSEPLLEGKFNRLVGGTRNKAVVSLGLAMRIVERVASVAEGSAVHAFVDRQGGRQRYGPALMTAFDHRHLEIVAESDTRSAYRLDRIPGPATIEFLTNGEDRRMPIALASIISKYLRELFMLGFNAYWADRVEGLRPTAGYYQDAQRFLADIGPALERSGVGRESLVRSR